MISKIGPFVKMMANRFGYSLISNKYQILIEDESRNVLLKDIINKLNIDCVIDVGANVGQFRDYLRQDLGYNKKIISIEPVPKFAAVKS